MAELNEIMGWVYDPTTASLRVTEGAGILQELIDQAGTTYYIGKSGPGIATSDPGWIVEKIDLSANPYVIQHASGIWDDRASLTYE